MVVKDEPHSLCALKKIYMLRRMTRRSWKLASRRDYPPLLSFFPSQETFHDLPNIPSVVSFPVVYFHFSFVCSLIFFSFLIFDFYISNEEYPRKILERKLSTSLVNFHLSLSLSFFTFLNKQFIPNALYLDDCDIIPA